MSTCCFTGHRILSNETARRLTAALDEQLKELISGGTDRFLCGGALGFDTLAAQAVLRKKAQGVPITLVLVLPCPEQDARWRDKQKQLYRSILNQADETICVCSTYVTGCMHLRDQYLVDHADLMVAHYRGISGGTQYTYSYAEQKGLKIINL